jgi:hypothetical protein
VKVARQRVSCSECPQSCFCGNSKNLEQNHLGGNNHVPWLFLPFCREHHAEFHVMCQKAGVDLRYIKHSSLALIQAFKAMLVGLWMVVDLLEKHLRTELESRSEQDDKTS